MLLVGCVVVCCWLLFVVDCCLLFVVELLVAGCVVVCCWLLLVGSRLSVVGCSCF